MKYLLRLTTTLLFLSTTVNAEPLIGDPKLGKMKAPSCPFCHGIDGIGVNADYPNLNNQNAEYLFNAMKAYQDGERKGNLAEMMQQQLSQLNNQDLADIAAYYSGMN